MEEVFIKNLKDIQKKQLKKFFDSYKKVDMIPIRRKDQASGGGSMKKLDARDMAKAVKIFSKYDEKWSEKVLSSKKWMEKKKLLDAFIKTANSPKLENARYIHITSMMKKLLKNQKTHIKIVQLTLQAIGALC